MSIKADRVSSEMIKELSEIIHEESTDKNLKNVSITAAKVTDDLSYARVYFTTLDDVDRSEIVKDMNEATPFFKKLLSERMDVRQIPDLKFIYDESLEYAKHIEDLIKEIHNN